MRKDKKIEPEPVNSEDLNSSNKILSTPKKISFLNDLKAKYFMQNVNNKLRKINN